MRYAIALLLALASLLLPAEARAQTSGQVVYYPAGWNMIGAPPGTNLSPAETLDLYTSSGYAAPSSSTASLCAGMWAYFPRLTAVPFTSTPPLAATITCTLQAGWTLVANPYLDGAVLIGGATGYLWDPEEGTYVVVTEIPLGASIWVYSASGGSVSLQPEPASEPTVSLSPQPRSGQVQLYTGQTVELDGSGQIPVILTANPRYLALEESGTSGTSTTWRFRAVAPGSTEIDVAPSCAPAGCLAPDFLIAVDILPAPAGTTVTIAPPIAATPYTAHVGDTIDLQLLLLGPGIFSATFDPRYLQVESATAQGAEPVRYDWRWLAIAPGSTTIVIDRHGPDVPAQYVISLNIQP